MRRRHDLFIAEQDVFLGRLDLEHVQRRARDMAIVQRRLQGHVRQSGRPGRS